MMMKVPSADRAWRNDESGQLLLASDVSPKERRCAQARASPDSLIGLRISRHESIVTILLVSLPLGTLKRLAARCYQ